MTSNEEATTKTEFYVETEAIFERFVISMPFQACPDRLLWGPLAGCIIEGVRACHSSGDNFMKYPEF